MYTYPNSFSVTIGWNRRPTAAFLYLAIKHIYLVIWKDLFLFDLKFFSFKFCQIYFYCIRV